MRLKRALPAACLVLSVMASAPAAADPYGVWATEGGKAHIRMTNCGGALCGAIVALSEPNNPQTGRPKTDENNPDPTKRNQPVIGLQIVLPMKPDGTNRWAGNIYNAEDGKIYSGSFTLLSATSAKLEGCVFGGLVCRGQTWTRVR
jgi:uncharacterized protein (DUF2147 family)